MREDYYEDDEPASKVAAAFESGKKGLTDPPLRGVSQYFAAAGYSLRPASVTNQADRELIPRS
jgi:hypothetical protein